MRISSSTMAVTGCTNAATGTPVPGTTARGGWYRRWRCRSLFCVFPYAITVLPLPISTGGVQMARRTGDTTGGMNGSSGEADGTAGTAESCRSLPRYRSISDTIQGTVIRKECSRSRYIARIIAINPATLKSGSIDQTTHSKRILHHGVVVSRKRPSNEGKGRVMASAPSSPHLRRVLPSAGILSSHSGQGKMGAAQILRRCRPSSGVEGSGARSGAAVTAEARTAGTAKVVAQSGLRSARSRTIAGSGAGGEGTRPWTSTWAGTQQVGKTGIAQGI